jgi:hypothetical protein
MPGSTLRHLVADHVAPHASRYDLVAATAAYPAAVNEILDEHGLNVDEHERVMVNGEWIDGDEVRELVDEAFEAGGPAGRGRPAPVPTGLTAQAGQSCSTRRVVVVNHRPAASAAGCRTPAAARPRPRRRASCSSTSSVCWSAPSQCSSVPPT